MQEKAPLIPEAGTSLPTRMIGNYNMARPHNNQQNQPASEETAQPQTAPADPGAEASSVSNLDPPAESGASQNENAQEQKHADKRPAEAGLREQLAAAEADRDGHREKWLRAEAELENYRKRVRREVDEFRKYQSLELARDLLPVLDNLDRALQAAEKAENVEELLQGVRMVSQQFREVLARHDIRPIEAVGHPFDPNLHEAVQQIPTAEHPPLTVLQELETGYTLHDRVLRPSKVVVAAAPAESPAKESPS